MERFTALLDHFYVNYFDRIKARWMINPPLNDFIYEEYPVLLDCLEFSSDSSIQLIFDGFNRAFPGLNFCYLTQLILFIEKLRFQRIHYLEFITSSKFFYHDNNMKYSLIPCHVNGYSTVALFDTGCTFCLINYQLTKIFNIDSRINCSAQGLVLGLGATRSIVGIIKGLLIEFTPKLTLRSDFVVIEKSELDFVLIGVNLMIEYGLKLNYISGSVNIPRKFQLSKIKKTLKASKVAETRQNAFKKLVSPSAPCFHVKINGQIIEARIDSGASSSVISQGTAHRLSILKYTDTNYQSFNRGLGQTYCLGKIPPYPVEIKSQIILFVPFEVIDGSRPFDEILLGADFLTWYAANIDFKNNKMVLNLDEKIIIKFSNRSGLNSNDNNQADLKCKMADNGDKRKKNSSKKRNIFSPNHRGDQISFIGKS